MTADVKKRQRIERVIARRVIRDAIHAGFSLNIDNGGDTLELKTPSTKVKEVLEAMFATDDEKLVFYKDGKRFGVVYFVYGNDGWDVICDHTINLDELLEGASKLAEKFSS